MTVRLHHATKLHAWTHPEIEADSWKGFKHGTVNDGELLPVICVFRCFEHDSNVVEIIFFYHPAQDMINTALSQQQDMCPRNRGGELSKVYLYVLANTGYWVISDKTEVIDQSQSIWIQTDIVVIRFRLIIQLREHSVWDKAVLLTWAYRQRIRLVAP